MRSGEEELGRFDEQDEEELALPGDRDGEDLVRLSEEDVREHCCLTVSTEAPSDLGFSAPLTCGSAASPGSKQSGRRTLCAAPGLVSSSHLLGTIFFRLNVGNWGIVIEPLHLDKRVDITIDENADNYSREQAEMILKSFLGKFSSRDFSVVHKGNSTDGAQYIIGSLKTNTGNFRTYIYVKKSDGVNYIQEIRFEKE